MSKEKKFGTFAGVFTPSVLTILGVIMYLRMGWVVGNVGLTGTVLIVLLAHVISISTGLSISSIATDKKIGAGGVYYILSRSLGLPIGGALGITLFVATALSIALYMVGFAEIFNEYLGLGFEKEATGQLVPSANYTNTLRIVGSLGLLALTILAFISTAIAIRTQFFILAAIVLSLVSIFLGDGSSVSAEEVATLSGEKSGWAVVFAVFFPAVTGFTAGVAMSGDLSNPKRSIPLGTMGAIATGLIIYLLLAISIDHTFSETVLRSNYKVLFQMAAVGILVYIGVWGATLSSALGGILGGPRILQAMSVDKITPSLFARGVGSGNEPRNALVLTVLIAEAGILIGDLNAIAELVSMFYLAAYGFINLSFFLESWTGSDFNPSFKVRKGVGLLGFLATFIVMSQLNVLAMIAAIVFIAGMYLYLSRKQVVLGTGDIWQSVWATVVKKGLRRMEGTSDHKRNWKPNMLVFNSGAPYRKEMIAFSKALSGQAGTITHFDLSEDKTATVPFPKSKEAVEDEELEKYGIFGRKLEVQNIFEGIEGMACTFGFSGIEPNTVLMGWQEGARRPVAFARMTRALVELEYNILYLNYDEKRGFRKQEKIDLWWKRGSNHAELTLLLTKSISASPDWSRANIRILFVNDTNADFAAIERYIQQKLEQFRVNAAIQIINNEVDKKPLHTLIGIHSAKTDLTVLGIPKMEVADRFVHHFDDAVAAAGTALLVSASPRFEEIDVKTAALSTPVEKVTTALPELLALHRYQDEQLYAAIQRLDADDDRVARAFVRSSTDDVQQYHQQLLSQLAQIIQEAFAAAPPQEGQPSVTRQLYRTLTEMEAVLSAAVKRQLPAISKQLEEGIQEYVLQKETFLLSLPSTVRAKVVYDNGTVKKRKIAFKKAVQHMWNAKGILDYHNQLLTFGYHNLLLIYQLKNDIHRSVTKNFLPTFPQSEDHSAAQWVTARKRMGTYANILRKVRPLSADLYRRMRNGERHAIHQLIPILLHRSSAALLRKQLLSRAPSVEVVHEELAAFSTYWTTNTQLFTAQLTGHLQLLGCTVRLQLSLEELTHHLRTDYIDAIVGHSAVLRQRIAQLEPSRTGKNQAELGDPAIHGEEELFLPSDASVQRLVEAVDAALNTLPKEVTVMTSASINGIQHHQGREIRTQKIALREVAEYLVKTNFQVPVHEQLQLFHGHLKRIASQLSHAAHLLRSASSGAATPSPSEELTAKVKQAEAIVAEGIRQLHQVQQPFEAALNDAMTSLKNTLDLYHIIEKIDTLTHYVREQKRKNKLTQTLQKAHRLAEAGIHKVTDYVVQRQQTTSATTYQKKYAHLLSEQGEIADFMTAILPKVTVPSYYRQRYTTTYHAHSADLENRQPVIEALKATFRRFEEGRKGAVLLLGSAASGKTALTHYTADHLLGGTAYSLQPPIDRRGKRGGVLKALQRAVGTRQGMDRLMHAIPLGTTFVIEDLEGWWLKSKGGDVLLHEWVDVISTYGSRHYFVLSASLHAYPLMSRTSFIQSVIAKSIVLPPLTPAHIRASIWNRHQTSGVEAHINGIAEQHLSTSKINHFLTRFHATSFGVVGMALHQWLAAIQAETEHAIWLETPQPVAFPDIQHAELRNLLYQLCLHRHLTQQELLALYGGQQHKQWIDRNLTLLQQSGVLRSNEWQAYSLHPTARPYVEHWLYEPRPTH